MVRTKTPTALLEPETAGEAAPAEPVAKTRSAEPTTVSIATQRLAEALASYAFALAAFGAGSLSPEGRAAFRSIIADLDNTEDSPPARYEVPADGAYWISTDLLYSRHQRPTLTGGEVMLGQAVSQQTPELARRLGAKVASRPPRRDVFPVPRPPIESVAFAAERRNAKFPNGQYFDGKGRPMESKPTVRSSW